MAKGLFSESANPILSEETLQRSHEVAHGGATFTMSSAINKTALLFAIMLATAVIGYMFPNPILIWGGAIAGLIVVIIAVRNVQKSATYAPIYAALEGFFVGGISAMYASFYQGIILQAVSLTAMVFFIMLVIYKSRIIKVTPGFRSGLMVATFSVFGVYLLSFVLSLFGVHLPYIHEGGTFGILFSVIVLGIASLNLLLDFDLFEKGEQYQAPVYMEWYAGMSLLITIVWVYFEILRLLSKLRD